jgi:RimJ/RimL family protein N-acetyltransferase
MVEVGYEIDPAFRRKGYARAALVALIKWAKEDASIQMIRATVSPDNLASRALVSQYGFVEVGEQWDDEDGLETIFEAPARAAR